MYGLFRTAADTWHVIEVPDNVSLLTFAPTLDEAVKQLNEKEALDDKIVEILLRRMHD